MKINKYFSFLIILFFIGLTQQSCTNGFENMNRDWKNPTQVTVSTMMNSVLSSFTLGWMEIQAIHNGYYYVCTQQLANAGPRYVLNQGEDDIWNGYYNTLRTIRALETQMANNTSATKTDNIAAMLKVCLAYKTLRTCDYFGDMPFTKAGYGNTGDDEFLHPAYDKQEDIYKACFTMLKEAADGFVDGASDQATCVGDAYNIFWKTSYAKDYTMWRKFANSIRLRYALQIADKDAATAQSVISEILGNPSKYPLLDSDTRDESAGIWPVKLGMTIDSRPWSFSAENLTCMGSTMWKVMTDLPVPAVGSAPSAADGVDDPQFFDPRGYVFFETNNHNKWVPQQQFNAPFVQSRGAYFGGTDHRDYGETAEYWNNKQEACYSSVNYYLVEDKESYPELMMTDAEVHFLKAEAYARGIGVSKDLSKAKALYEAGIRASIKTWFSFVDLINASSHKWVMYCPATPTDDEVTAYINHAGIKFDDSGASSLKQIYKQVWIDSFRQPWVAFNLLRRVGAENLPNESGIDDANAKFYRVPYPSSEINYNKANYEAALAGRENTPQSAKLFWQK